MVKWIYARFSSWHQKSLITVVCAASDRYQNMRPSRSQTHNCPTQKFGIFWRSRSQQVKCHQFLCNGSELWNVSNGRIDHWDIVITLPYLWLCIQGCWPIIIFVSVWHMWHGVLSSHWTWDWHCWGHINILCHQYNDHNNRTYVYGTVNGVSKTSKIKLKTQCLYWFMVMVLFCLKTRQGSIHSWFPFVE